MKNFFHTTKKVLRRISLPEDFISRFFFETEKRRLPTLPHCIAVPSAQAGLTSLFGMGRGGTPPLSPPDMGDIYYRLRLLNEELRMKNEESILESCSSGFPSFLSFPSLLFVSFITRTLLFTVELTVAIQLKVCAKGGKLSGN